MEKKKLTLNDLALVQKAEQTSRSVSSGVKGKTKDNPYSEAEAYSLIDKGCFRGGFVEDRNGLVSYWLGAAEVIAYNSASKEDVIFDFNSDFYVEFCNNYYGSDYYPFGTSESSISLPYADGTVSSIVGAVGATAGALDGPKKINYGSNGKFYFETKTGRVFCGNQYVGTTSVNGVGAFVSKYVGKIDVALTVYNVVATYKNEGVEAAGKEAAVSIGGMAGSKIGRWAAATLGAELGAEVGVWGGDLQVQL